MMQSIVYYTVPDGEERVEKERGFMCSVFLTEHQAEQLIRLTEPDAEVDRMRHRVVMGSFGETLTLEELFAWNTAEARDAVCYALIVRGYEAHVEAYLRGDHLPFRVQATVTSVLYKLPTTNAGCPEGPRHPAAYTSRPGNGNLRRNGIQYRHATSNRDQNPAIRLLATC